MASSRQLAAIMFTDIVGYTALMGKDEKQAFDLLRKNREIQKLQISHFNGKWIKELGDGVLASFHTVTDAVMCAAAIHEACAAVAGLQLRIGIHLGEVVFENDDVFGDGVNIASRLQTLAPIGGTWVSESIYKNIFNKKEIIAQFIKEESLKNVSEPVKIYELTVIDAPEYKPEKFSISNKPGPVVSSNKKKTFIGITIFVLLVAVLAYFFIIKQNKPASNITSADKSIAVLYFDNMSGDPEQEYFSDGITEEIITHISKIKDIRIISRTSVLPYKGKPLNLKKIAGELNVNSILEGSVRKSGDKIRITAQLIDARTDQHLWAETFDRDLKDIFAVQSEIARMIAQKFEVEISADANSKISQIPTSNVEAYEQFQKGYYFMYKKYYNTHQKEDFEKAKKFFERAIELDPNYAEAYAGLAEVYDELRNSNVKEFPKDLLVLKEQLARKALQLKPNSSFVNTAMAWAIVHRTEPKFDSSFYYLKKAYFLAPADPLTNFNLGTTLANDLGLHAEAIPFLLATIKADPLDPVNYSQLGNTYAFTGKYAEAKKAFQTCTELSNDIFSSEFALINWQIYFGEFDKAQKRLDARPGKYLFQRALLHAAKGELEKVDTVFRNNNLILLISNRNKVLKDVLLRIEEGIDKGDSNYNWLSNSDFFDVYRKDPEFKRILEKAKKVHENNVEKYGNIEMPD